MRLWRGTAAVQLYGRSRLSPRPVALQLQLRVTHPGTFNSLYLKHWLIFLDIIFNLYFVLDLMHYSWILIFSLWWNRGSKPKAWGLCWHIFFSDRILLLSFRVILFSSVAKYSNLQYRKCVVISKNCSYWNANKMAGKILGLGTQTDILSELMHMLVK